MDSDNFIENQNDGSVEEYEQEQEKYLAISAEIRKAVGAIECAEELTIDDALVNDKLRIAKTKVAVLELLKYFEKL